MGLTGKQQAFVEEYLRTRNATEAARRSGYSLRSAYSIGAENLTKPEIRAVIDARLSELRVEADTVIAMLVDHANGTMDDFISLKPDGTKEIDLKKARRNRKMHLIKRVKETKRVTESYTETTLEIELHDPQAAIIALGRYHRLFTERVEVVDWRKEVEALGLNPDDVESDAVNQWVKHLRGGAERADGGVAGEGEEAG